MSFTKRWLEILPRPRDGSLVIVEDILPLSDPLDDDELLDDVARELRRNYVSPDEVANILDGLGAARAADHLRANKFPKKVSVRHGEFGEAMAGAIFRQQKRYCMPILKLRYKFSPDQPVHGTDVLGFRLTATPPIVAVPEVKTRANRDKGVAREAQKSLEAVLGRLDQSITFVHSRFASINPTLASQILRLLDPGTTYTVERHIVIVHEFATWKEDVIDELQTVVEDVTQTSILRIARLRDLVISSYERAGDGL